MSDLTKAQFRNIFNKEARSSFEFAWEVYKRRKAINKRAATGEEDPIPYPDYDEIPNKVLTNVGDNLLDMVRDMTPLPNSAKQICKIVLYK